MEVNSKETTLQLNKPQRNASLDVLRVLAMFMIVLTHCFGHGDVVDSLSGELSVNSIVMTFILTFFGVHVDCFVLVSGYFLCTSKFRLNKWLKLWGTALFWSLILYIAFCLFGISVFDVREFVKTCMPFTQQRYWFLTTYLLMYMLTPIYNIAILHMTKKQHFLSIVMLFGMYILFQNIIFWREFTSVNDRDPFFFIILYFIASYIRKYPFKKTHKWFLGYLISSMIAFFAEIFSQYVTIEVFEYRLGNIFNSYSSVTTVIGAVCFFMIFLQADIKGKIAKFAVAISPLTFGVYLIHEQPIMRGVLWGFLKPYQYAHSPFLVPIVIIISIIVFAGCCLLEKLRIMLFSALKIDKVYDEISANVGKLVSKININ